MRNFFMKNLFVSLLSQPGLFRINRTIISALIKIRLFPTSFFKALLKSVKYLPKEEFIFKVSYDKGLSTSFYLKLDSYVDREIFSGQFETTTLKFYLDYLLNYRVVWDIGSNIGFYTILAGLILKNDGKVYAFEPMPAAFERLNRNILLNKLENIITLNYALGESNCTKEIYFLTDEHITASPTLNPEWASASKLLHTQQIEQRNAYQLFEKGIIGRPDLIKIDAETYEPVILSSIKPLLILENAPDIICEVLPPTIKLLQALLLSDCGYSAFHISLQGLTSVKNLEMRRPYNDFFFTKSSKRIPC